LFEIFSRRFHRDVDILPHVLGRVELRLLRQEAYPRSFMGPRLSLKIMIDARHDAEQ
jgi:hypothetical protein